MFKFITSIILSGWIHVATGNYPRGTVIDSVNCLKNPEQTYSLYLPEKHMDPAPLLIFLEPGGRGKLPVSLYSGLAERYGLILACSNNGRNGPPELYENALDAMIMDLIQRFAPDSGRMIYCGFSGGARYAAIYSNMNLEGGVIACGAGMSPLGGPEQLELPFYTGITGRMDMNYLDVAEAVEKSAQLDTPTWMISFDGGHSWPDTIALRRAVEQAFLQWHILGRMQLDSSDLDRIRSGMYAHLDSLLIQKRHFEAKMMQTRLKEHPLFDSTDTRWIELLDRIPAGREKKKYDRLCLKIRLMEKRYQDSIISAFKGIDLAQYKQLGQLKPDEWWKSHGRKIRREMKSDETLLRESAFRKYDFTWRNCMDWGYIHLVDLNEPEQATRYIRAWCNFDPESPTAFYWLAIAYAESALDKQALKALDIAADNGFSDTISVENVKSFDNLRSREEFRTIIQKMKD